MNLITKQSRVKLKLFSAIFFCNMQRRLQNWVVTSNIFKTIPFLHKNRYLLSQINTFFPLRVSKQCSGVLANSLVLEKKGSSQT